jgi:hypothetical protein
MIERRPSLCGALPVERRRIGGERHLGFRLSLDRLQPLQERIGEDQPPLPRRLRDRTACRGQLLVRPAAEKSHVGFHSLLAPL